MPGLIKVKPCSKRGHRKLMAKKVPYNFRWSESVSGCGVTASANICVLDRNARKGPMAQRSCHCTSTGQDVSIELEKKGIGQAALDLQRPQGFGDPTIMPRRARWANDHTVANLLAKTAPLNLRWSESMQWWLNYSVSKIWRDGRVVRRKDRGTDRQRLFYIPPYLLSERRGQ